MERRLLFDVHQQRVWSEYFLALKKGPWKSIKKVLYPLCIPHKLVKQIDFPHR